MKLPYRSSAECAGGSSGLSLSLQSILAALVFPLLLGSLHLPSVHLEPLHELHHLSVLHLEVLLELLHELHLDHVVES